MSDFRGDSRPWYETAFGADYLERYPHREHSEAALAVRTLLARVPLERGARVLDLCCGAGRHAAALSREGMRVVGLDLSGPLLAAGARLCRRAHLPFSPARGSMDALPFRGESFDLVVNFFTAFGYFEDESRDAAVIAEVARVLRPGGWFLLDFLNREQVVREIESGLPCETKHLSGDCAMSATKSLSGDGRRGMKTTEIVQPDGECRTVVESVRLYTAEELAGMFDACGIEARERWGDYRGGECTGESPRCILLGQRR